MADIRDQCANCQKPYASHDRDTYCDDKKVDRWFPQHIADALTRQRKRIRKAQITLGKASHHGKD